MGKFITLAGLVFTLVGVHVEPGAFQEHRGCCSHHHGVCGCENDRAKCCDGSLSPTCGCD